MAINITDKKNCCGCEACVQRCPKQCITMNEDEEGFLYPKVNLDKCIDCGLCEKICPVINQSVEKEPMESYACQNESKEVRMQSSSGGIFTIVATHVINNGGVVFGARWDENMNLKHDYAETIDGIAPFRSSKYVQSYIGDTFKQAETFLKQNRKVLFSGVPCQIAALKKFLRKDYTNLITIDVLCHGVPSPGVFRQYSQSISQGKKLASVNFRDKSTGWKGYSIKFTYDNGKTISRNARLDEFMRGFLNHYMLRPSCHNCPSKAGKSGGDITLGDLWGINKLRNIHDDDTGMSAVFVNTEKGMEIIRALNISLNNPLSLDFIKANNGAYYKSSPISPLRDEFWADYKRNGITTLETYNKKCGPSINYVRYMLFKTKIANILNAIKNIRNK